MKIIRWLLSHFFLILLIVSVIYGYMFWGNLAGEDTPAGEALAYLSEEFVEVEEFINAVKAKQAKLSFGKESLTDVASDVASLESATQPVEKRNIEQLPVSISYSHNRMRMTQNSDGEINSSAVLAPQTQSAKGSTQGNKLSKQIKEPVPSFNREAVENTPQLQTESNTVTIQDEFVSTDIQQQLNNVDKNGRAINKPLHSDAIRDIWITARKSFYQRKYELSEQSYQDVIDNTDDNFDAYGELGNVYFNQGKNQQAATAYYEAAAILVRKGQIRRAINLLGVLRRLDNNKANELKRLIDSAVS